MANLKEYAVTKLATVSGVDLNTTAKTTLYTCPTGKSCVVHKVVVRNASASLATAAYGFGWDSTAVDNVASATHTELTGSTLFTILSVKTGATVGVAGSSFGLKCGTAQGTAATVTVDVFGHLY